MKQYKFHTKVHAKCILAGEHAVMRGHPALVCPINTKWLKLSYSSDNKLSATFDSPHEEKFLGFFLRILDTCKILLKKKDLNINGHFIIENNIPISSGLGFSSAICLALTYWVLQKGWIEQNQLFNFARQLEDIFHGKSSGVDIAGVLANNIIIFNKSEGSTPLKIKWQPYLYLSASDHNSPTSTCVKQVARLWQKNRALGEEIDKKMFQSVTLAKKALTLNKEKGFSLLVEALSIANSCFKQWQLISPELQTHINKLLSAGAVAAKPTGSGGGGYVLSLWQELPPSLGIELIPVVRQEDKLWI